MNNCTTNILVAVYMITYNHGKYILDAIESVMEQKTNFNYKLIIGDDKSLDCTIDKIEKLVQKYPDKIDFISNNNNLGATNNASITFSRCFNSGAKYIALLEGDDYWTDKHKLQKQVDFLEANPDYTICFHKVQVLENNKFTSDDIIEDRFNKIKTKPVTIDDLLEKGNFIHTPSVVFRNVLKVLPFEFSLSTVGDYFLYIILAKQGFIKRLDDVMAVYRRGVGVFSSQDLITMKKNILIYQACILSYLDDNEQKKKILSKHISLIHDYDHHYQSLLKPPPTVTKFQNLKHNIKKLLRACIPNHLLQVKQKWK